MGVMALWTERLYTESGSVLKHRVCL